jgi:hypothetical protein
MRRAGRQQNACSPAPGCQSGQAPASGADRPTGGAGAFRTVPFRAGRAHPAGRRIRPAPGPGLRRFGSGGAARIGPCTGSEQGPVGGSNPWTSDSNLCVAARHAGVIGPSGGTIPAARTRPPRRLSGNRGQQRADRELGQLRLERGVQPEPSGPPPGAGPSGPRSAAGSARTSSARASICRAGISCAGPDAARSSRARRIASANAPATTSRPTAAPPDRAALRACRPTAGRCRRAG